MTTFAGVNHFALTITDLDVSQRFYTEVLGFVAVLDVGHACICLHNPSGFTIALVQQPQGTGAAFTERNTGLDHIGLAAGSRDDLVIWEERFRAAGVTFTPIQDLPLGHHLNFRDPDGIALELQAPSAVYAAALAELRSRDVPDSEVLAMAEQLLGGDVVARPPGTADREASVPHGVTVRTSAPQRARSRRDSASTPRTRTSTAATRVPSRA